MANLLIIEDEKRVAELIQKGLYQFGHNVDVAYDGDSGISKYNSNLYDLVICDIMLPTISGFEVCKHIRKENKNLPILMLSALGETDDKLDGFDSGADDYMVKPFDLRELNARIKILITQKGEQDTREQFVYDNLVLDNQAKTVIRDGIRFKLSPKECLVLHLFIFFYQNNK